MYLKLLMKAKYQEYLTALKIQYGMSFISMSHEDKDKDLILFPFSQGKFNINIYCCLWKELLIFLSISSSFFHIQNWRLYVL